MKVVGCKITEEKAQMLKEAAEERGYSVNQMFKIWVDEFLKRRSVGQPHRLTPKEYDKERAEIIAEGAKVPKV